MENALAHIVFMDLGKARRKTENEYLSENLFTQKTNGIDQPIVLANC